jgi:hypothetical protein
VSVFFVIPRLLQQPLKNIVPKELHLQRKEFACGAWEILTNYREYGCHNLPDDTENYPILFLWFSPHYFYFSSIEKQKKKPANVFAVLSKAAGGAVMLPGKPERVCHTGIGEAGNDMATGRVRYKGIIADTSESFLSNTVPFVSWEKLKKSVGKRGEKR